jgi:beta-glucanase (GH16 family)
MVLAPIALVTVLLAATVGSSAAETLQSSPNCGSTQIRKSTGGYWQCSFSDDFGGGSLDSSKWLPQQTANSGYLNGLSACFVDSPNNISVSGGSLNLTARQEPSWFWCPMGMFGFPTQYTSGMVTSYGRFSQTYGRYAVRARVSAAKTPGLQSSFWLWPVDSSRYGAYPASGEIDFAELYSAYPDRAIPYIHYNAAGADPHVTNNDCLISDPSSFHNYAVEWTPSSMTFIYDGQTCLVDHWNPAAPLSAPQPFDQPFFIALTQALGVGNNAFNPWTTPLPATTEIDYVRVWE